MDSKQFDCPCTYYPPYLYGSNHIMTNNQEPTSLVGTLIYLAPEQILKMKANSKIIIPAPLSRRKTNGTTKTDVWSVG